MSTLPVGATQNVPTVPPNSGQPAGKASGWDYELAAASLAPPVVGLPAADLLPTPSSRSKRAVLPYEIKPMPDTVEGIRNSESAKSALIEVADAVKRHQTVREVEIKVYSQMFKANGRKRGAAVKQFLMEQGVKERLINVVLKGPGFWNPNWELARANGVRIELDVKDAAG